MSLSLHRGTAPAERSPYAQANRFLGALARQTFARLRPELESVELRSGEVLWEPDERIQFVYFPHSCVISMIVVLEGDHPVEAGTVGREGFLGVPVLLGAESTSTQALAQVPGAASRLSAAVFRRVAAEDEVFRGLGLRYAQALLEQTAQSVACNGRHELSERCARWLLMTGDRVDGDQFFLTQEFLATMLGVRRATVTIAAGILQRAGFINYKRGRVTILDREALERASCECYAVVRTKYDTLIGLQNR